MQDTDSDSTLLQLAENYPQKGSIPGVEEVIQDLDLSHSEKNRLELFSEKLEFIEQELRQKGMEESKVRAVLDFMHQQFDAGNLFYLN